MASLSLKHIYKVYGNGHKAVTDFCMEIPDKEFVVLVGPSGCGKSTTLRMIAGLEEISTGELYIDGNYMNNAEPRDRDIAMVFQNYALYPHMTIYDNIAFGLKMRTIPDFKKDQNGNYLHDSNGEKIPTMRHYTKDEIDKKVRRAAQILGITDYLKRKPKQMSGGQRQRVALGRAIVREPKVMLLDEPLSNLDAKLRTQMRSEISKLHKKLQTTFIYVTHDQVEAMTMGTIIVVMKDGFVQQIDTPKNLYNYPCNKFVAGFIGTPQMNFFDATIAKAENGKQIKFAGTDSSITVPDSDLYKVRPMYMDGVRPLVVGLRAEDVSLDPNVVKKSKTTIKVRVSYVEEMGSETLVYGDINPEGEGYEDSPTRIIIKADKNVNVASGDLVDAALDMHKLHLFDKESEESIVPRIVEYNDLEGVIENGYIDALGGKVKLPPAIACPDGKCLVTIPSRAIHVKSGNIPAKVLGCEKINDVYLVELEVNGRHIYAVRDQEAETGATNIDIDIKSIGIKVGDVHIEPVKEISNLFGKFRVIRPETEVDGKKKKGEETCYLTFGETMLPASDRVQEIITSALTKREAFKAEFKYEIPADGVKITQDNGIEGVVEKFLDYGDEKFVVVKVGENDVTVKVENEVTGTVRLIPDVDKIGIIDNKNDIRLV